MKVYLKIILFLILSANISCNNSINNLRIFSLEEYIEFLKNTNYKNYYNKEVHFIFNELGLFERKDFMGYLTSESNCLKGLQIGFGNDKHGIIIDLYVNHLKNNIEPCKDRFSGELWDIELFKLQTVDSISINRFPLQETRE